MVSNSVWAAARWPQNVRHPCQAQLGTQFSWVVPVIVAAQLGALVYLVWYLIRAQRVVYGNGLAETLFKSAGITFVYLLAWVPALTAVLTWALLLR